MKPGLPSIAALTAVVLSASAPAAGQVFTEDISIVEVEVPVQVLVGGRSVRGLERENFELLVDGEPQELTGFEAIEIDETLSAAVAPTPTSTPEGAHPSAGWRRHYLVLFDFGFSSRSRTRRAVDSVRRMVADQLHPTDRLAIALFAEAVGARLLVPFTTDRHAIELGLQFLQAITDAKPRGSIDKLEALDVWWAGSDERGTLPDPLLADMGRHAGTLIQPLSRKIEAAGVGLPIAHDPTSAKGSSQSYRLARLNSLLGLGGDSLSAVRSLGRSMASLVTLLRDVPEPKNLLFLSQGLGGDLFDGAETRTPVLHRLKPMLDACGDTGWTLHTIDIGGIAAPPTSALAGPEDFDATTEVGLGIPATAGSDNSSLFYLANETGGELFENYNRIHQATGKLVERTRAIYLLSFQPRGLAADGERHTLEVRLEPQIRNAKILHRPGFRAPLPATERLLAARRMDAAEAVLNGRTLDELRAGVLAPVVPAPDGTRVPVFVTIPADQIDSGTKGQKKVRLDVHAYAVDASGTVRAGFTRELKFRLDGEAEVIVADEIALPPGAHELRVLAWDLRGGKRHLSSTPLESPPVDGARPSLLGPYLLASSEGRRQFAPARVEPTDALALFELDDGLVALDAVPVIESGRSRGFLVLVSGSGDGEPPDLELRLRASDGTTVGGTIAVDRLAACAGTAVRFAGVVDSRGLSPGRYRLEAGLGDAVATTELTVVDPD